MKKKYNKILIIFSLIIFLYYILNRRIIHEGLNYNEMSKEQKKDHDKKFKDAKNNYKWIKDKGGYKIYKAVGGKYKDWVIIEDTFKGKSKNVSSEELSKLYPEVNKSREKIEDHRKKYKDARNNYNWVKDQGYKMFKASGGTYSEWEDYKNKFKGTTNISSDDLSKVYNNINSRRKRIEDHRKKYKDTKNNYYWIKDQGGYKMYKAVGGKYKDWVIIEDTFRSKGSILNISYRESNIKNISYEELSKIYTGVNQIRKKIEDHQKKFKDAKNNYKWIKDQGGYKMYKAVGGKYKDWVIIEDTFKGKSKDVSSEELSKLYTEVNQSRKKIEDHEKKFKDAKNNYKYMIDKGGYKTYKAAGGKYNDWKLIEDTFKGKGAKDVSSEELSKVYPIVNEGREKVEKYKKTHKTCPGTKSKCFFKNIGALAKNMVNLTGAIVSTVSDSVKLSTNTVKLFT